MFSFIYLGFLLLVLGFFAHYIFHRFEEQNHKIKTLGKILTSITTELKDMKEIGNKYQEEDEVVDLNENVETDNEVEEVKPTLLETINTNNLCIVSDDDTDYEDDDEEEDDDDDDDDDEENKKDILRCQFMQQSGCGVGVNVGRIDPFTLMSIFAGTGVSSGSTGAFFTTSGNNSVSRNNSVFDSAFDIDENIVENIDEELVEEEEDDDKEEEHDEDEQEINVLKNVNESVNENVVEKVSNEILNSDYKKMSVEQLRKCVTSKGLTTKVSKLKKMELVELLENNNN